MFSVVIRSKQARASIIGKKNMKVLRHDGFPCLMLRWKPTKSKVGLCPATLQFYDMTVIGSVRKGRDEARQMFVCVVYDRFRLFNILERSSDILVYVKSLETVSYESEMCLVISSLTVGPSGGGYVLHIDGTSPAEMIVE